MSMADRDIAAVEERQQVLTGVESSLQLWDSIDLFHTYRSSCMLKQPVRVLLAEDNLIDQMSIRRLLEKEGAEVTVAGDGSQAVDVFEHGIFDFILLDILMPNVDGFEAAMQIRKKERHNSSRIPILALTSYSLKAVCDKCKSVGMNGYLSKPVAGSDLRWLIATLQSEIRGQ